MSVVRSRLACVCLAALGLAIGSSGCGTLRDWASDSVSGGAVAASSQAPRTTTENLGPGAMGLAAIGASSTSNAQLKDATESEKAAAPPVGSGLSTPLAENAVASAATSTIPQCAQSMPLDLPEALGLAGAENPTIAIARMAVVAAMAEQVQARALLLPNLNAGVNYDYHAGGLQSSFGAIRDEDRQAVYVGAGAGAVGAGTVAVPGVQLCSPLTDAIFAPRVANNVVAARQFDASASNNNVLLDVGVLYYSLVGAEARLAAIRQTESDVDTVARLTADHAAQGQGRQADADRARSEALLFHQQELQAEEEVAVSSARLAQVLNVDPSTRLISRSGPVQLLELVNLDQGVDKLIETAIHSRPEMAARSAAIQASQERYREEQARPFLPTLSVGYSAGGFGGGSNLVASSFSSLGSRSDLDVVAFWTWQDLGLGNLALQRRRRAEVLQAEADQLLTLNTIRDEVAESFAQASASQRKLSVVQRQLRRAQDGFQHDLQRVRSLEGRPIEVLNSVRLLATARQDFVLALTQYNQAQLRLFVSLGQPPRGSP